MTSMKYVVANMLVFDTFIISMCVVPTNTFESISIVSLSNNRVGRSPLTWIITDSVIKILTFNEKVDYKTVIECGKSVKYIYWVKKDLFGCFR